MAVIDLDEGADLIGIEHPIRAVLPRLLPKRYPNRRRWIRQSRATRYRGGLPDGDVHFLIDGTDELTLSLEGGIGRLRYGHSESAPLLTVEGPTDAVVTLLCEPGAVAPLSSDLSVEGRTELLGPLVVALRV